MNTFFARTALDIPTYKNTWKTKHKLDTNAFTNYSLLSNLPMLTFQQSKEAQSLANIHRDGNGIAPCKWYPTKHYPVERRYTSIPGVLLVSKCTMLVGRKIYQRTRNALSYLCILSFGLYSQDQHHHFSYPLVYDFHLNSRQNTTQCLVLLLSSQKQLHLWHRNRSCFHPIQRL